jgi:hypothetical protein
VNAELPCGLRAIDVANHAATRALLAFFGGRHAACENTPARSTFRSTQRLLVALQNSDFADMRRAISGGADVNAADLLGTNALHQAVLHKSAADIVWLLSCGARIDAQRRSGDAALHLAVLTRHLPTVELLLAAGADPTIENFYGCCPARQAARLADVGAWRAITTHVAAGGLRHTPSPSVPVGGSRARRRRVVTQPAEEPVSAAELHRRAAAAEAAAAELLAADATEKAVRARRDRRITNRKLKKQKQRLALARSSDLKGDEADDAEPVAGLLQHDSSPEDDDLVDEPDWLADLLEDFTSAKGTARRTFVENSVRMFASVKLQLGPIQQCMECMEGACGTLLQPCGHTQLCRACAMRVAEEPVDALRRCPMCMQPVAGWAAAFL